MGRRVILTVLLLGSLIAAGQMWVVSSLLSQRGPDGMTGWQRLSTAAEQAKRRRAGLPLVEGIRVTYKYGTAIYGCTDGDDKVRLRLNDFSPGLAYCRVELYFQVGENTIWCGEAIADGPFPEEVDCFLYLNTAGFYKIPSGDYPLCWASDATGSSPSGPTNLTLSIDADAIPPIEEGKGEG